MLERKNSRRTGLQSILLLLLMVLCTCGYSAAQSNLFNKYGLLVIKDINILKNEIKTDSNKRMIELQKLIPGLILDLKYATDTNFMHQKLYPSGSAFLRKPVADSLVRVINELKGYNLSLKIFDAYRPYSITEKMWEIVKDSRYAADPSKGSGHNRGIAIDLTLIDLYTKMELPMGTGFDNFSDTAHQDFSNLPDEIINNRNTLKSVMEKYGFKGLSTEWWHYYLPSISTFALLDLSFSDLQKLK